MEAKQFGQFIAGIRKEKKMTQAELAEKINVTDKAVSPVGAGAWISGYSDTGATGAGTWNLCAGIDAF